MLNCFIDLNRIADQPHSVAGESDVPIHVDNRQILNWLAIQFPPTVDRHPLCGFSKIRGVRTMSFLMPVTWQT